MGSPTLAGYVHVCTYSFQAADGSLFFAKKRYELLDPLSGQRSKQFRYWDPSTRSHRKRPGADALIYRLPDVLAAVEAGRTVYWTEGEKDADELRKHGAVATSHHQGAGRVTPEQAAQLRGARRVVLWVDLDRGHWEVGAYDAVLRHNLLIDGGVPARRIRIVRALTGKDAFDHLQHHAVSDAVPVDKQRLAAVALRFRPAIATRLGYRHA